MVERKQIPCALDYFIDVNGVVYDKDGNPVPTSLTPEGRPRVRLFISKVYKYAYRQVARLLLDTFCPVKDSDMLSVRYADGDMRHVSLSNVSWSAYVCIPTDIPGINLQDDAYVSIPGYSRYAINLKGEVLRISSGNMIKPYSIGKYITVCIVNDLSNRPSSVGIYRLLALTFLRHPWDCEHLVINHIDGDPLNNRLPNLEWVSYSRNNRHAYEEGVRSGAISTIIKNIKTGEIKKFSSLTTLSEFLDKPKNQVHVYLTHKLVRKFHPLNGWMLKLADDSDEFPEHIDLSCSKPVFYMAFHLKTHTALLSTSAKTLMRKTGVDDSTIMKISGETTPRPWKGWMFKSDTHEKVLIEYKWPNYTTRAIELFEKMNRKCNPIKVTDLDTQKVSYWLGIKYWWRHHTPDIDVAVLCRHLKQHTVWKHFEFEYINLYSYRKSTDLVAARVDKV